MKRKPSPTTPAKREESTNVSLYFKTKVWEDIQARAKELDLSASQYVRLLHRRDLEAAKA
jgi:hypothetical protein